MKGKEGNERAMLWHRLAVRVCDWVSDRRSRGQAGGKAVNNRKRQVHPADSLDGQVRWAWRQGRKAGW